MNAGPFEPAWSALAIPEAAQVKRRIPKDQLDQTSLKPADRRRLESSLEALWWLAVLRPSTVAIPATLAAPELPVLGAVLLPSAARHPIAAMLHRCIPYPVLLLTRQEAILELSVGPKEPIPRQPEHLRLCGPVLHSPPVPLEPGPILAALPLHLQHTADLSTTYQSWTWLLLAWHRSLLTHQFLLPPDAAAAATLRAALDERNSLLKKVQQITKKRQRASQMRDRVALGAALHDLEQALAANLLALHT
jgi:Domain of unknown function (DUF4391)